jgi:hypothetical protein
MTEGLGGTPLLLRNPAIPTSLDELLNMSFPELSVSNSSGVDKKPPPEIDGGGSASHAGSGGVVDGAREVTFYCWMAYDVLCNLEATKLGDAGIVPKLQQLLNYWDTCSILYRTPLENIEATEDKRYRMSDIFFINRCYIRYLLQHQRLRQHSEEIERADSHFAKLLPQIYKQELLLWSAAALHPARYSMSQLVDSIDNIAQRWCITPEGLPVRAVVEQLLNRAAVLLCSVSTAGVFDMECFRNEARRERQLILYNGNSNSVNFLQARLDGLCFSLYSYVAFPRCRDCFPQLAAHDSFGSTLTQQEVGESSSVIEQQSQYQRAVRAAKKKKTHQRRRKQKRRLVRAAPKPAHRRYQQDPAPLAAGVVQDAEIGERDLERVASLFRNSDTEQTSGDEGEDEDDDASSRAAADEVEDSELLYKEAELVKSGSWQRYRKWLRSLVRAMRGEAGSNTLQVKCVEAWVWAGERQLWELRNKGEQAKKEHVVSDCIGANRVTTTHSMLHHMLSPTATEEGLLDRPYGYDWGCKSAGTVWRNLLVIRAVCSFFKVNFRKSWGNSFLLMQEDFNRCIDALGISHRYPVLVQNGAGDGFDCWYKQQYVHSRCAERAFYYWLYFVWRDFKGHIFDAMDIQSLLERIFGSPHFGARDLSKMELDSCKPLWSGSAAPKNSNFVAAVF